MSAERCMQCGGALERGDDCYCAHCRELPCFACGKTQPQHDDELPASGARPRMPCLGLKRWYRPRKDVGGES